MTRGCPAWVIAALLLLTGHGLAEDAEDGVVPPWGRELEAETGRPSPIEDEEHESIPRIWVKTDYIAAWMKSGSLPALASTGLTTDATPGAIGLPYTQIIYGVGPIDYKDRTGFRVAVGANLDDCGAFAVEGNYFTLGGREQRLDVSSPGSPIIARPFFDVVNQRHDSSLITYPGFLSGSLAINNTSYLQSAEINALSEIHKGDHVRVRALAGLRTLRLRESLGINEVAFVTDTTHPFAGQTVLVGDFFETTNNFYGGQVGVSVDMHWKRFIIETFLKGALGDVQQNVNISGGTTFSGQTFNGGLLAQTSNIGSHRRDRLGVVPEGGVSVETPIGKHLVVRLGYSFLYFGKVVRPGPHVDLGVNPNLVPTSNTFGAGADPARPAFAFHESNFWAHVVNVGITIQY